jgi:hypothetical protein
MSLGDALAGLFQGTARGLGAMYQMEQDEQDRAQRKEDRADADRKWRMTYDNQLMQEMNNREDKQRDRLWQEQKDIADGYERHGIVNVLPAVKQLAGQGGGMADAQNRFGTAALDALKNADANRQLGRPLTPQAIQVDGQDTGAFYSPTNLSGGAGSGGAGWTIKQDGRTNLLYRVHEASGQSMPLMMPDGKTQMAGMPNWAQSNPYLPTPIQNGPDGQYNFVYKPGFGPEASRPAGVAAPQGVAAGGTGGGPGVATVPTGLSGVPNSGERNAQALREQLDPAVRRLFAGYQKTGFKAPNLTTQASMDQLRRGAQEDGVIGTALGTLTRAASNAHLAKDPKWQEINQAQSELRGIVSGLKGGQALTPFEENLYNSLINITYKDTPETIQTKFRTALEIVKSGAIQAGRAGSQLPTDTMSVPLGKPSADGGDPEWDAIINKARQP